MMRCATFVLVAGMLALLSAGVWAQSVTITAVDSGHYQVHPDNPDSLSHGLHAANNRNYAAIATGGTLTRNFFVIDSDQLPANIVSARLLIDNKFTTGGVYTVRSVTVSIGTLTASHTSSDGNLEEGVAIYEALDDGEVFGCATLSPYDWNVDPEIPQTKRVETVRLNAAAVAALNAASGEVAIAGAMDVGNAFTSSDFNDTVSLVVSTEPDTAPPDPCAVSETTITAVDSGHYQVRPDSPDSPSHGLHLANNRNYAAIATGGTLTRNFFVIDSEQLPANITSARLLIDNKFTTGGEYTVRSVTVPIDMLTANHTGSDGNLEEGVAIYEALDEGEVFGCATLSPYDWNVDPEIPQTKRVETVRLNAAAVAALNAASGEIAIAGTMDAGDAFTSSDFNDTVSLVVSPEPDSAPPDPCVTVNLPPTANAGPNQAVRPGDMVQLDGSASFDDNDPVADLEFTWVFLHWPGEPGQASPDLHDASSPRPWFLASAAGTYELQLTVADSEGLNSAPDTVEIGTENLAPVADAGTGRLVLVGEPVLLDGTASSDAESDPLTFQWTVTSAPEGSTASIVGAQSVQATLTPDEPGTYLVALVVSDLIGPSTPDEIEILALTGAQAIASAQGSILEGSTYVQALGSEHVTTRGNGTALGNYLRIAVKALDEGDSSSAIDKLYQALVRVDGCALRGGPDGNGQGRDWVTDCPAQEAIYQALQDALFALTL